MRLPQRKGYDQNAGLFLRQVCEEEISLGVGAVCEGAGIGNGVQGGDLR